MADRDAASHRRKALRRGHVSEYLAAAFLMLKGYRIVALRYRTRLGEIDIIARKGDLAVFVEVNFAPPSEVKGPRPVLHR